MKDDKCCLCGEIANPSVELIGHEDIKGRSDIKHNYCRRCWNKYYRPSIAIVTELLDEIKRMKK